MTIRRHILATVLFTGCSIAGISTTVLAQPGGGIFALDADGNGRVTREEFQVPKERRGPGLFARADADGDGLVTREEIDLAVSAASSERAERMRDHALQKFDEMDADESGAVTPEEATDHAFARIDADGDGAVTEDEARKMRGGRGHGRGKRGPDRD